MAVLNEVIDFALESAFPYRILLTTLRKKCLKLKYAALKEIFYQFKTVLSINKFIL